MAENESLNLGRSRRWQTVLQKVGQGGTTDEIATDARRCLYRTLKAVRKQIPFGALLDAACKDADALPDLIRECRQGRDYARLFQHVACEGASREEVLQDYQRALCDNFFDQIRGRVARSPTGEPSPAVIRERLNDVKETLGADFKCIASKLAENPEAKINMPRRERQQSRQERAKEMSAWSLLEGVQ
jgi:hypothetical protein